MKRLLRFVFLFASAFVLVTFLPLYFQRTRLRSWRTDRVGDVIEWGWKICSLKDYWSNYRYIRPEQSPAFWLTVNLGLAVIYAALIAFVIDLLVARRRRIK